MLPNKTIEQKQTGVEYSTRIQVLTLPGCLYMTLYVSSSLISSHTITPLNLNPIQQAQYFCGLFPFRDFLKIYFMPLPNICEEITHLCLRRSKGTEFNKFKVIGILCDKTTRKYIPFRLICVITLRKNRTRSDFLIILTGVTKRILNSTNKRNNPDYQEAVFRKVEATVTLHFQKNAGVQLVTVHTTVKSVRCATAEAEVV